MTHKLRTRLKDDTGSVSAMVAAFAIALFAVIGLVVDGGGKIWAKQRAATAASEAARAGGQAIVGPSAMRGLTPTIDTQAAVQAARKYLTASDVQGTVAITGGQTLTVTTRATHKPIILGLIGIGEMSVEETSSARLARGIRTEGN